jgi:hypothetical protein
MRTPVRNAGLVHHLVAILGRSLLWVLVLIWLLLLDGSGLDKNLIVLSHIVSLHERSLPARTISKGTSAQNIAMYHSSDIMEINYMSAWNEFIPANDCMLLGNIPTREADICLIPTIIKIFPSRTTLHFQAIDDAVLIKPQNWAQLNQGSNMKKSTCGDIFRGRPREGPRDIDFSKGTEYHTSSILQSSYPRSMGSVSDGPCSGSPTLWLHLGPGRENDLGIASLTDPRLGVTGSPTRERWDFDPVTESSDYSKTRTTIWLFDWTWLFGLSRRENGLGIEYLKYTRLIPQCSALQRISNLGISSLNCLARRTSWLLDWGTREYGLSIEYLKYTYQDPKRL